MKTCFILVVTLNFCVSLDHLWHSYQHDPMHKSREEIVIKNISSVENFKIDYVVDKWKALCFNEMCYGVGVKENSLVVLYLEDGKSLENNTQKTEIIQLNRNIIDIALCQHWNITLQKFELILTVAIEHSELLWFRVSNTKPQLFWSWKLEKSITHLNIFEIEDDFHLLAITQHLSQNTADIYKFDLKNNSSNFWLRQKLDLTSNATTSAAISFGPDFYLAIPQKSIHNIRIYKLKENNFVSYKNLTSTNVDTVVAFKIHEKSFLAFNGQNAGIYKFTKTDVIREIISGSHTDGITFWLPISASIYGDDALLVAQRSLQHGNHISFVIEIFTYNGLKFEEHEDVPCSYFGEKKLSCLLDEEHHTGITESVSLSLNGKLKILVPRKDRSSELFTIETELKTITNPLHTHFEKFLAQKEQINQLMLKQEKRYEEISRESTEFVIVEPQLKRMEEDMNSMKERVLLLEKNPIKYETAVFNGLVKIKSSGIFDELQAEKINGEAAEDVFGDIVLKNNVSKINSEKLIQNLEAKDLIFEKVNDINASDLLFSNDTIIINGDMFLTKPLMVNDHVTASEVNGLAIEIEVIDLKTPVMEPLEFEKMTVLGNATIEKINKQYLPPLNINEFATDEQTYDSLFIPHNLKVTDVNNHNFEQFLKELCLKNIRNYVPGRVQINGDILVEQNVNAVFLNDLLFPEEYVFDNDKFSVINGTKTFVHNVFVNQLVAKTIDDIPPSEIITVTTDQIIPGTTCFSNLKITESLNVKKNITGKHASQFLPNPTLLETDHIKSKAQFQDFEIDGTIIVENNFNGENLEQVLSDIIYDSEETVVVEAMKQFPEGFSLKGNLIIESDTVNDVSLKSVVTKNTEQTLNLSTINGAVTFENLEINGLYNGIDIHKFDEELIKLDGEQYISSTLIFEDNVTVNELEVIENLKKIDFDVIANSAIDVDNIIIKGDLNGEFDNFNFDDFDRSRMSYTLNQIIDNDFKLNKSKIKNLKSSRLNKVQINDISTKSCVEKLKSRVQQGELGINNLLIKNSIDIDNINNKPAMNLDGSLSSNALKKYNMTTIMFKNNVHFDNITVTKLGSVNFTTYLENMVFKNETNPTLSNAKTFTKGINVENLIETKEINSVALPNILTKHGVQTITGPITIKGNVIFEKNVKILENIDSVPIRTLTDTYQATDNEFQIKGDVLFNRLAHIHILDIDGFVNDKQVQKTLDNIIYIGDDMKLEGVTIFNNKVDIAKNIQVNGKINNVKLADIVPDIILTTKDTVFKGPVKFLDKVFIKNQITLHKSLKTHDLNGVDIKYWRDNAVSFNRGFLKGQFLFENISVVDTLLTEKISDIDTTFLIPLRTAQNLSSLNFNEITLFRDVHVQNTTNGRKLIKEFDNSVLINTDQALETGIEFVGKVFVEGEIKSNALLNGFDVRKIVTTTTDQELNALYGFNSKVSIDHNLSVQGLINDIDINVWSKNVIKTSNDDVQNITNNWNIETDLILEENSHGDALINNINFKKLGINVEEKRNYKYQVEKRWIDNYINICKDLTFMYDKAKTQIYKFNYFENLQTLNLRQNIDHVFTYQSHNTTFLILSESRNCESYQYIYENRFRYMKNIHFGHIAQIIRVQTNNFQFFVVRNQPFYSTCKVEGTHLWQLDVDGFVHRAMIEEQDLLQESLELGTFYGLRDNVVTEFHVLSDFDISVKRYRKWIITEKNTAFVPRGLATGLALSNGRKLIRLKRDDFVNDDDGFASESVIIGNWSEDFNVYLPGRADNDLAVMKVGVKKNEKVLLAVASHEETSVKGSLDFIKIYENAITGKMFHKVPTYKPSSLLALDFSNGETLLAFMEDRNVLQLYEYKGIEGFKHKLSLKIPGTKLFKIDLKRDTQSILGLVDKNKITFMEVVMFGNQIKDNLHCSL